jgi:hypothetical protein
MSVKKTTLADSEQATLDFTAHPHLITPSEQASRLVVSIFCYRIHKPMIRGYNLCKSTQAILVPHPDK